MGSSKKHKDKDREHKRKRKHRSRSASKEREGRESKKRHRDREYEDNYPPFDREDGEIEEQQHGGSLKPEPFDQPKGGSGGDISLSIEETNKLRAKLGLKPLEVEKKAPDLEKESLKDDIHKPAENWGQNKATEKIREKVERSKQKREISKKLEKIKTLGESDSDEDAATWVRKNRMKQREKERADKTAKMLEEMDEEFGIGNLVEQEFKGTKKEKNYSSRDLRGLKVEHDMESFREGHTVILTLKDKGVLDEEEEETLVNVNMMDDERAEKNIELRKKKPDYNPYDEADVDEYGLFKPKEVLSKYDEEIEGQKKKEFKLGSHGTYNADQDRQMEKITAALRAQSQTLTSNIALASEYMTQEEAASFKKVKKKFRKIRKKKTLKADDLLPLAEDEGAVPRETVKAQNAPQIEIPGLDAVSDEERESDEDVDIDENLMNIPVEPDEAENELQAALNKARKLKQKKNKLAPEVMAEKIVAETEARMEDGEEEGGNITLNATSEFCRALGDIPTYGQSGNRAEIEKDELADLEKELLEQRQKMEDEEEEPTGWNRVEIDETPVNITGDDTAILEDEPVIAHGMGGALKVALNKGFLEHEEIKPVKLSKQMMEIQAQNYSIEDKRYDDLDEKYKKRGDRYTGMLMDFKEKSGYKPEVKLEYVDEGGRHLNSKEAFRQLSHRFHGKGSGKKKTEKRAKKVEEEQLMQKMSATDTPLNTVALLREKQSQEKTPYIVLTGNKGFTHTMVKPTT